jgi:hypothetical protein
MRTDKFHQMQPRKFLQKGKDYTTEGALKIWFRGWRWLHRSHPIRKRNWRRQAWRRRVEEMELGETMEVMGEWMYQELGSWNWKQSGDLDPSTLVVAISQSHVRSGRIDRRNAATRSEKTEKRRNERTNTVHVRQSRRGRNKRRPGQRALQVHADRWARARAKQTAPPTSAQSPGAPNRNGQTEGFSGLSIEKKVLLPSKISVNSSVLI